MATPCLGQQVQAGPNVPRTESSSQSTRLVTGQPDNLRFVVAGHASGPIIQVVPRAAPPVGSYPAGTVVVPGNGVTTGGELRAFAGGFRVWVDWQVGGWAGAPVNPGTVQARIDAGGELNLSGFRDADTSDPGTDPWDDGDQPDLGFAHVACRNSADCVAAFGDAWARCEITSATCDPLYVDRQGQHPQSYCTDFGAGHCTQGDCVEPGFHNSCFALTAAPRPDPGFMTYFATTVIDVPSNAKGRYVVLLHPGETFLFDSQGPPVEIPSQHELGFAINILGGACCYGYFSPEAGCADGLLLSECGDDEPGPVVFAPEASCPPVGPECSSYFGACCDARDGTCEDPVLQADCTASHSVWTSNVSCDEVECTAETGACCTRDPFESCSDAVTLAACQCAACTWHKLEACDEIECVPASIPAASAWGLAALTLLLMIGAKVAFGRGAEALRLAAKKGSPTI
jgi:hypothetical protein